MFNLRKKWVFSWLLACLVAVTYFLLKPHQAIVFLKDSKLMSRPFPDGCISGCQGTSVLAEIHAGDTALIMEDFDTKDFHVRKIRVKDGKEGYVFDDREFKSLDP